MQFLNTEPLLDAYLLERKGYMLINEGRRKHRDGEYDAAVHNFSLALRYVTHDFRGIEAEPIKRAGVLLYDPNDILYNIKYDEWVEQEMVARYKEEAKSITSIQDSLHSAEYNEIISGLFILTNSRREETLIQVLGIAQELNDRFGVTVLSFHITLKTLICLDQEENFNLNFDELYKRLEDQRVRKLETYASIKYFKLFRNRKENSLSYLISLLTFFLKVPYSASIINLLAKYQFQDFLSIEYDIEVLPKITAYNNHKDYKNVLSNFKGLLSYFAKPSENDEGFNLTKRIEKTFIISEGFLYSSPGYYYKYLLLEFEPTKGEYRPLKFLQLFHFIMNKKLFNLQEIYLAELKKLNPDFDDNDDGDCEYEDHYDDRNFIDNVFEGDESNQWNID